MFRCLLCPGQLDGSWSLHGGRAGPAPFRVSPTGLPHKEAETHLPKDRTTQQWIWGYGSDGCTNPHHTSSREPQSADLILGGARQKYSREERTKNKSPLFLSVHMLRWSEGVPSKQARPLSQLAWWSHEGPTSCCEPPQSSGSADGQRNPCYCIFKGVCSGSVC